jgi:hypothetical protein
MSFKKPSNLDKTTIQEVIGTSKNPTFRQGKFKELPIESQRYLLDRVASRVRMRIKSIYDTDRAHNAKGKYIDVPSIRQLEKRLREFAGRAGKFDENNYTELTKAMRLSIKGASKTMSTDEMAELMFAYTKALTHKTFSGKGAKEHAEKYGDYIDERRILEGFDESLKGLMEMIFKNLQGKYPYETTLRYKALDIGVIEDIAYKSVEERKNEIEDAYIEELADMVVEEMRALGY